METKRKPEPWRYTAQQPPPIAPLTASDVTENPFKDAKVDHVVSSKDGSIVFGVLGGVDKPVQNLAQVKVAQTLATSSMEGHSQSTQQAMQQRLTQEQTQTLAQSQALDAPTATGPVMRIGGRTLAAPDDGGGSDGGGRGE
jgi:hypothetical protein